MIAAFGARISAVFRVIMPDPLVLAIGLTILTAALALVLGAFPALAGETEPSSFTKATALLDAWGGEGGLWKFLAFGMQMCLILLTGYALAESKPVRAIILRLASAPRSCGQGVALVGLIAAAAGLVNWGLGLIVGALLARDVARSLSARGVLIHYPLLVASGYMGLLVWHGGLSGSALITSVSVESLSKVFPEGIGSETIQRAVTPLDQTLLSTLNIVASLGLLALIPITLALMMPKRPEGCAPLPSSLEVIDPDAVTENPDEPGIRPPAGFAERLEHSRLLAWLTALAFAMAFARFAQVRGLAMMGPNEVNTAMLAIGLAAHGSLRSYIKACGSAASGCVGVIIQFPLYAGIMGMLVASGLLAQFSRSMASIASADTLPILTMCSAGLMNLAVPSGGGQWGIQGPIAMESGAALGVRPATMILAVAYGDQLTNMLQPFWALPLLAITRARARDIVGYTAVVMLVAAVWLALCLVTLG